MDNWEQFNETSLPRKEDFHTNLNMGDIKDLDYNPAKRVCKHFEIKYFGEYHNLYLKSNSTLLLADILENLTKASLEIDHKNSQNLFRLQD